jgi:hypothetical protein
MTCNTGSIPVVCPHCGAMALCSPSKGLWCPTCKGAGRPAYAQRRLPCIPAWRLPIGANVFTLSG